MRQTSITRAAIVLAASAAATVLGSGASAHAATVGFPDVPTVARGGLCWTTIQTWADTSPEWPGRAILNMRAAPVSGVGPGRYPLAPLCEVKATVAWRNVTTGAAGVYENIVVTGIYGSIQYALFQDTGPGRVDVTVTTDAPSIPAHASFDVPA
ncbi:hypothetical protein IU433_09490 [Nocardia puris]|uniref:Secreted protein n=1 Tax=Nocardia puris TaxID=208602 RepID=A0A366DRR0_9NOCA|nr:hypothetical protein [Nocardia puris]MBF6210745.1 hypothetical protein [Nocardia puris]MBF6364341.1 hypothetical protein [Nocardia puris]MBF6459270.1 hypothetical protein [Nocardia puris]RBO92776.1 hypothetical protein DFR74_103422 [Nocardia puris]